MQSGAARRSPAQGLSIEYRPVDASCRVATELAVCRIPEGTPNFFGPCCWPGVRAGLVGLVVASPEALVRALPRRPPVRSGQTPEASAFAGCPPLPRGLSLAQHWATPAPLWPSLCDIAKCGRKWPNLANPADFRNWPFSAIFGQLCRPSVAAKM